MRNFLRRLVPKPRRPLTWADAVPFLLFAAVYGGVLWWLIANDKVLFTRPAAFGWLALAPWLAWLAAAGHGGLANGRAGVSGFVRLCLLGCLVAALAEPRAVRVSEGLSVVYVVDTSDSIGLGKVNDALEFVARTVAEKPAEDRVGLVAFGRNAAVELPPRPTFPLEKLNAEVSGDATNLEEAMRLAAALIGDEDRGRIVLVTDGTQTAGRVESVLDELAAREIAVDTLPLEYQYDRESWVERLELPSFVKLGESYNAGVLISSLKQETGTLTLTENGKPIGEVPVELKPGKNRLDLPLQLRAPGFYEYAARLTVDTPDGEEAHDHLEENNVALGSIFVRGQGRVMLVTDPLDEDDQWRPFAEAMRQGERIVDVVETYDVPRDPLALMPYDCIVFNNVPRDAFDRGQIDAVATSVYDQGIGFLMVGGPNSFGPGGWRRSKIEEVLPVALDVSEKKVLPKGALAIVLHTCEFAEGNAWAKRITKEAIRVLSDEDEVGVLAYSGTDDWVVEMQPAANLEKMVPAINGAAIGDMPAFAPAMRRGFEGLMETDASARHMIIISDGDPQPPPPELVKKFVQEQISVSMVAIFPHEGQDMATMRSIAGATGGKFHYPSDPNALPAIFIKEAKTLRRNLIQRRTVTPQVGFPSPVLAGIDSIPPVEAYILTSTEPRGENVLVAEPDDDQAPELDPILALGRYGLGTTAAFTSDLASAWDPAWITWGNYRAFVTQLITRISRTNEQQFLRLYTFVEGGETVITVEDFHPEEMFLDVQAKVSGPRGESVQVPLRQTGPRRYQASVPTWGKGRYLVNVVGAGSGEGGDRTERGTGGWVMPYSPEYLRFESDPITINQIRETTGGRALETSGGTEDLFDRREPKRTSRPVFDWLLMAVACLLPLDVALRRIQLDWATVKDWFRGDRREDATRTTGQLLQRATEARSVAPRPDRVSTGTSIVSDEVRRARAETLAKQTASAGKANTGGGNKPSSQEKPKPGAAGTASKLLDMKRKRDEGG